MASIGLHIDQIKKDPSIALASLPVRQVCRELKLVYRQRLLDPVTTVGLFIKQVANGNSSCARTRHLGKKQFTAQAYCEARMRLPLAVLTTLSRGHPMNNPRVCPVHAGSSRWAKRINWSNGSSLLLSQNT